MKVLRRKIKDSKHKTRVLLEPNVQKLILDKKSSTKAWGIAFKLSPKKNAPPTFSHGEGRWGKGGV